MLRKLNTKSTPIYLEATWRATTTLATLDTEVTGTTLIAETVDDLKNVDDLENEVHHLVIDNPYMTVSNMMQHTLETIEATETGETPVTIALHPETMLLAPMLKDSNVLS